MSLWFVVTILGHTVASAGPLPYDMAECELRKAETQTLFDANLHRAAQNFTDMGVTVRREDIVVACIQQDERPVLDAFPPAD